MNFIIKPSNHQIIKLMFITGIIAFTGLFLTVNKNSDLAIYELGSRDILAGKDAYSASYVDGFHYYYSVLFAIIIYPLTLLPAWVGNHLWFCLNVFFLFRITVLIYRYYNLSVFTHKQKLLFFILSYLFALRFLLFNFHTLQVTFCIMYLSLEGLNFIFPDTALSQTRTRTHTVLGALLIALGINIKILPIVFIPYLIYRKKIFASFMIIIFYAILLFLPGLAVGFEHNNFLLSSWWRLINPANKMNVLDVDERSFQSLSTLLATLLVAHTPDRFALPIRRNIMDISYGHLDWVLNITRFILVAFTLYFLRTKPFKPVVSREHHFIEISYILLLIPLIFPHQQAYEFIFIMPAVSYIIYYLMTLKYALRLTSGRKNISRMKFKTIAIFLTLSYLLCNLDLLLGEFRQYYDHFKILTYGALIVIPLLAICFTGSKNIMNEN